MSRIQKKFLALKNAKQKALIVFLTAGDPSFKKNEELIHAFEKEGADLIEIGVPFSDPLADGPVIQAASQRSLKKGTTLPQILKLVRQVRKRSELPLILMSYLNPIWHYGLQKFAKEARRSGVDGVIVPDLPPEEGRDVEKAFKKQKLDLIYLLAPTSGASRQRAVARRCRGFIYYVSLTGVTGIRKKLSNELVSNVRAIQRVSGLPVCAGFGISTPEQAKAVCAAADGVIIGSAVVKAIDANRGVNASVIAKKILRPFARALGKVL